MVKYFLSAVFLLPLYANAESEKEITAHVSWIYKDVPGVIEIYESAYDGRVWEMGNIKSFDKLPIKQKIKNDAVKIKLGGHKTFVLVYKNETKNKIHFFAAPHSVEPPMYSLGFRFKCLCVNHVFSVKPGWYWYRVVEMTVEKTFRGQNIDVTHNIIKVDDPNEPVATAHKHHD